MQKLLRKETRLTRSFVATDDAGKRYNVNVHTKFEIWLNSDTGEVQEVPKIPTVTTDDGVHVNVIGKGVYELFDIGVVLRSTEADPF